MHTATWLRRAGWLGMVGIVLLSAAVARAQAVSLTAPKYWLNMRLTSVSKALDAQLDLKGEGVLVDQVGADGPADKAGIKPNDILLAVGDKPIKKPADLESAVAEGKFSIKLLRAGKQLTVSVTPEKLEHNIDLALPKDIELKEKAVREKLSDIEKMVREKLKDAGIDGLRMQFLQPGKIFPPGFPFPPGPLEFPDDLSITIRKHGKSPAEIEVKKGDQTWTVKEDDLASLAENVRPYVESLLGRGPRFNVHVRDFARRGPGPEFGEGPDAFGPPPGHPDGPPDGPDHRGPRRRGSLEQRLDELSGNLIRLRDQIEDLRRGIREERRHGE